MRVISIRWSFVVACLVLLSSRLVAQDASPARQLITQHRVLVIAHRGDSLVAPENTLPAFQSAVEAGSDLVELDYVHSADGVPIVIHDETLDRTTDAKALFGGSNIAVDSK